MGLAVVLSRSFGVAVGVALSCAAAAVFAQMGGFQLEIRSPGPDTVLPSRQTAVEVAGRTALLGGVRKLDLILVLDSSRSLRKSDPKNHRAEGAVGLVKSLGWSDARVGVVDFDRKATLVSPLTGDRTAVRSAIRSLDQDGKSDLGAGIAMALDAFAQGGRPGSQRMMLVFSDGKLKKGVTEALADAQAAGVSVSTVLLGSDTRGRSVLEQLAEGTGGSFVAVSDPKQLPDAFMNLRTTGVDRVELRVNGKEGVLAKLAAGGSFAAEVPLEVGENRIVATATSFDGRQKQETIVVKLQPPGCAELTVRAERDGRPVLSVSNRAVEIVVDGSGSMRGRMEGRTKMAIAKEILDDALNWLPADLNLSLRAYGHQYHRDEENCEDTQLLVPPGSGNRDDIRAAIAGLRPQGQTPLGHALGQIAADFGDFHGERAVVLLTDGIESCDGDAPSAARALQQDGRLPVHVIGFGLGKSVEEDLASLRSIADASGGRFIMAGSAKELRSALGTTVGTPFRVLQGDQVVAQGTLGGSQRIRLPAGQYRVLLDSSPGYEAPVSLTSEEVLTLVLQRNGSEIAHASSVAPAEYAQCD